MHGPESRNRRLHIIGAASFLAALTLALGMNAVSRGAGGKAPCETGLSADERNNRIIFRVQRAARTDNIHGNPDLSGCTPEEIREARVEFERRDDRRRARQWFSDDEIISVPGYVFVQEEQEARESQRAEAKRASGD